MPSKLMRVKAAVALLAAVLSIGGVAAAATSLLPTLAQPVADQASTSSDGAARGHAQGDAAVFTEGTSVNQAARGLCQAWRAGQGGNSGGREASAAFRALAAAAGGVDKIAAYCQGNYPWQRRQPPTANLAISPDPTNHWPTPQHRPRWAGPGWPTHHQLDNRPG